MNRNRLQRGFTLLEISIVMIIAVALAVITTQGLYLKINHNSAEHTAAEIWSIGEYAQHWISTPSNNGEWPGQSGGCGNAIAVMAPSGVGIPIQSPWDTPYVTSCVPGESFSIQVQLDDDWAPALMNMLAVTRILPGTSDTTITTLPLPGSIAALSNVLRRTADPAHSEYNRMETDIDMNDFDINKVGSINANKGNFGEIVTDVILNPISPDTSTTAVRVDGRAFDGSVIKNSEPGSPNGSIDTNDIYMRSIGEYISSRLPNMVEKTSYVATVGDLVPKPLCPHEDNGAATPTPISKIRVRPASDDNTAIDFGVIDDVEYWQVRGSTVAKAEVYCYYPPLVDPGYEEVIKDTTPPSAPINFALTSTSNAGGTARFSVTPNTELDLYHYILRKDSGVGGNTNLSFEDPNGIQVSALIEGNPYTYYLIAVDYAGNESDPSNLVTFTMQHPPATPTGFRFIQGIGQFAILEVTPNRESDIAGYQLYFAGGRASGGVLDNPSQLVLASLREGTNYTVYVRAVDTAGNQSPPSSQVTFNSGSMEVVNP